MTSANLDVAIRLAGISLILLLAWLLFRRRDAEPAAVPRGTPSRA